MQEKYSISCEMTSQPSRDPAEDEDKGTDHKGENKRKMDKQQCVGVVELRVWSPGKGT
jgi:hypothetical protein